MADELDELGPIDTEGWIDVISSNVERFRYFKEDERLEVTFNPTTDKTKTGPRSGRRATYQYLGVPASVYELFLEADSKGKFVWGYLRGRYSYVGPY